MARYIDAERLKRTFASGIRVYNGMSSIYDVMHNIDNQPTADVVEVETIKSWLYEMAINNVGCVLDGDFSDACQEIISRFDGLRKFAQERK